MKQYSDPELEVLEIDVPAVANNDEETEPLSFILGGDNEINTHFRILNDEVIRFRSDD